MWPSTVWASCQASHFPAGGLQTVRPVGPILRSEDGEFVKDKTHQWFLPTHRLLKLDVAVDPAAPVDRARDVKLNNVSLTDAQDRKEVLLLLAEAREKGSGIHLDDLIYSVLGYRPFAATVREEALALGLVLQRPVVESWSRDAESDPVSEVLEDIKDAGYAQLSSELKSRLHAGVVPREGLFKETVDEEASKLGLTLDPTEVDEWSTEAESDPVSEVIDRIVAVGGVHVRLALALRRHFPPGFTLRPQVKSMVQLISLISRENW